MFNSDKKYRSSTTQDTTALGSKTVQIPVNKGTPEGKRGDASLRW